jgi:DNA-binding MarR family transcriptional regulator
MSSQKRKVFGELLDEIRRSQNATERFDLAVAEALGLNRTDLRCMDFLQREGPLTAGRLAELTGLTTGAMTTVIDRLERAGYAQRDRDPADRRRVVVALTPLVHEGAARFYGGHLELSERLYRRYSREQLDLLLEFVRQSREFNEEQALKLELENRGDREEAP